MHTFFIFTKCYWSIHSEVVMLGKNAHSKQRKATHTQTLQFRVTFMYMPCWFSTYIACLVWSNIRSSLDAEKAENLIKIYRFCRADEDNR